MKGPGLRIDLDVRRIWRCPRCGRVARTSGGVTAQRCRCVDNGMWMQLQQPVKREPFRPAPRDPEDREPDEPDEEPEQLAEEPAATVAVSEVSSSQSIEVLVVETSTELSATVEEVATPEIEPPAPVEVVAVPVAEAPAPVDSATPIVVPEPRPESTDDGFGIGVDEPPPEGSPDDSSTRRV